MDLTGRSGKALSVETEGAGCRLTQFAWVVASKALTYVTECGPADTGTVTARLNIVMLNAVSRPLYTLSYTTGKRGTPFSSIDLAPTQRALSA